MKNPKEEMYRQLIEDACVAWQWRRFKELPDIFKLLPAYYKLVLNTRLRDLIAEEEHWLDNFKVFNSEKVGRPGN
ncbi:MAG: hypothetical protein VKL42_01680 [Snowella sp.]|nr:hypothetical protein [Snowella sp.]